MRTYKEQTENILDMLDKHNNEKKKRLKFIYSTSTVVASLIIIIGVIIMPNMFNQNINNGDTSNNTNIGIQIPPLEISDNNSLVDMVAFIMYNGKIYEATESILIDDETKKDFVGEYLGTASGTIDEYSQKSEYDKEFSSNVTGDVYTVNGYDKNFRICIYNKYEGSESITFYENLNGITLTKGEDLYGNARLNFKGNFYDVTYQLDNDLENKKNNYKHFVDVTDEDISKFIDELYNSPFVDLSYQQTDILMNLKRTHLYFNMNDGTTVSLNLFENGYVIYGYMHGNVFVKMDTDIFKKIFDEGIK